MARHGPLKKPTMASMPVLLWMADHPDQLLVSSSVLSTSSLHFAYHNGSRYRWKEDGRTAFWDSEDERPAWHDNPAPPEIPKNLAIHRWMQSGWLVKFDRGPSKADDKDNPDNHWSWYDHPYRMTKAGKEMTEKWRAKYEEHARKKAEANAKVERLVIVRSRGFRGSRQYGILAKVVRETASRLYIERVEGPSGYCETIHGRRGHEYVEKDDVTKDGVTQAEFQAMKIVETNHMAWLEDLRTQEQAEIDEIKRRYDQRREQNQYAYEDELREALEQVKRNATQDTD